MASNRSCDPLYGEARAYHAQTPGAVSSPIAISHSPAPNPADSTYTVSGARDYYRQQSQFVVEKVPVYGNLFSELRHFPAAGVRWVRVLARM